MKEFGRWLNESNRELEQAPAHFQQEQENEIVQNAKQFTILPPTPVPLGVDDDDYRDYVPFEWLEDEE